MKRIFSIVLVCVALALGCGKDESKIPVKTITENTTTKKFFNQDGQFKIQFEQNPTVYSQYIPYEEGKVLMNYFIYEKGINLIYCISYADYPEKFMKNKVATDVLAEMLVNYVDEQKAGVERQKMIMVNNWPGIFFKVSNSDVFVYGEYILKKNRLYQLTVTKEGSYQNEAEANAFLQSLELLD